MLMEVYYEHYKEKRCWAKEGKFLGPPDPFPTMEDMYRVMDELHNDGQRCVTSNRSYCVL